MTKGTSLEERVKGRNRIMIRVERDGMYAEIPIRVKDVRRLYEEVMGMMLRYDANKSKMPRSRKREYESTFEILPVLEHVVNDIIDNGRVYEMIGKGMNFKRGTYYLTKKPQWKKYKK